MCGFGVAQALSPPTGTAARPFGPSGASLPVARGVLCVARRVGATPG